LLGGIVSAVCGALGTVAVSLAHHWQPVVDLHLLLRAPLGGMVLGVLAGLWPARLAVKVEPATPVGTS
jgi:H+/Cl- antiporter ClcA